MPRRASLISLALVLAILGVPWVAAAQFEVQEREYVAQSTWGIKHILGLDKLWITGRPFWIEKPTGAGVKVGIIDTGIDATHPDLQGVLAPNGWRDFIGDWNSVKRTEPYDDHGHGTHVAGIIAARGHFQPNPFSYYWIFGNRGLAPSAQLLVAKAMDNNGIGDDAIVAEAIRWAMDPNGDGDLSDGADVINLSIGIEKTTTPRGRPLDLFIGAETKRAVELAVRAGVVVVVSSGNDGKASVAEPGSLNQVITVGALDQDGNAADFSNWGRTLDVMAPGVLVSTFPMGLDTQDLTQDGYVGMAGTSMAAPVVSAIVALMMEADPSLREKSATKDMTKKVALVESVLKSTAQPVSSNIRDRTGAGAVDAYAAVLAVDRGSSSIHWSGVTLLGLVALAVAGILVRSNLRKRKEKRVLTGEPEESGH